MLPSRFLVGASVVVLCALLLTGCQGADPAPSIRGVTIEPGDRTVEIGGTLALSATVTADAGADPSVDWASDADSVAAVDGEGVVTGVAAGSAVIRATSTADFTHHDEVTIAVTQPPPDVSAPIIHGVLRDVDGRPIAGAQVALGTAHAPTPHAIAAAPATSGDAIERAAAMQMTDEDGVFGFDVDRPGAYTLTNLGDTTGAFARILAERQPDGSLLAPATVAMTALPLGAVTGSVDGRGAGVLAFLAGTSFLALTDADGAFVITRVPAGHYEAMAGVAGTIGAAQSVDVPPGATVALEQPLTIGPSIRGVTPSGLVPMTWTSEDDVEPATYVLHGTGFGDRQGLSVLRFAGFPLDSQAVSAWTDDTIEVDGARLVDLVSYYGFEAPTTPEDLRFSVVTVAGEAVSEIAGPYEVGLWFGFDAGDAEEAHGGRIEVFGVVAPIGGRPLPEITMDVSVRNGRALGTDGAIEISSFVTSGSSPEYGGPPSADFLVEPSSALPVLVTITARQEGAVGESAAVTGLAQHPSLTLLPQFEGARYTITT